MDEFGSHGENERLRALIVGAIASDGPLPFARFMELALYHPALGYYASRERVIGPDGDYLTSPEVSPLFGAMVGRQLAELWQALGQPDPFTVVEAGPGNGTLALDVLLWAGRAAPALRRALRYVLVERAPALRERQQRLLGGEPGIAWADELPAPLTGAIIANELLDAFPVHVVRHAGGQLQELFIDAVNDAFVERWAPPTTPALADYFTALGRLPGEGARAEVNLAGPRWVAAAGAALQRGLLLLLDYGYPAGRLYAPWRRSGTLLCFTRHTAHADPLVRVGRQDITAHVDFTTIARAGVAAGLTLAGFTSQRAWLAALGIHEAVRLAPGVAPDEEFLTRRRAIAELLAPEGLGRVAVLALTRGLDGAAWRGFADAPDAATELFGDAAG